MTSSSYFRLPQYRPVDIARTPSLLPCRLANTHPPVASYSRACPQSPAPPYPLVLPTVGSLFDVRGGGSYPHSGWAVRRCHRALSPTIEELSPPTTTTTPVLRRPVYRIDGYFDWDRQNIRCSRAGEGVCHYTIHIQQYIFPHSVPSRVLFSKLTFQNFSNLHG